ncbi:MAG TPA: hypothetical protein VGD76_21825 [Ramlibacter sp.]
MSLSWRERYAAVVTTDRVALVRTGHGWRTRLETVAEVSSGAPRQAALDAVAEVLALAGRRRGELTVVLSSHFVRYLLVPWRAEIGSPSELEGFATICCDETFGSEPAGRSVITARERASSARVAAAVDNVLLEGLRSVVAGSALRLVSVQPYLSAAFDGLRRRLPARDFMFLLAEPARSCVLVASGGRWRSVRSVAHGSRGPSLADLVEREAQLTGLADEGMPPVFVHAPGQDDPQLPACHGVTPQWLAWPQPAPGAAMADPLVAMARAVA